MAPKATRRGAKREADDVDVPDTGKEADVASEKKPSAGASGSLNIIAIVIVALIVNAFAMLYYSPLGMGDYWLRYAGIAPEILAAGMTPASIASALGTSFVLQVVTNFVLSHFNPRGFRGGFVLGFWVWIAFYLPAGVSSVVYEHRPWELLCVNQLYYLTSSVAAGSLLGVWP